MLEFFKLIHGWSIASWKFNLITGCLKPDPLGGQSAWCFSWGPWSRRDTIHPPHQAPSMENWCMKAADTPAFHKQGVSKIALVDGTSAVSLNNAFILAAGGFWGCAQPSSNSGERGFSSCRAWGSHRDFSYCRAQDPGHSGSAVVGHKLSCSAARGILPDQRWNPWPLHWQADA